MQESLNTKAHMTQLVVLSTKKWWGKNERANILVKTLIMLQDALRDILWV
jgi:hypothetical protein